MGDGGGKWLAIMRCVWVPFTLLTFGDNCIKADGFILYWECLGLVVTSDDYIIVTLGWDSDDVFITHWDA